MDPDKVEMDGDGKKVDLIFDSTKGIFDSIEMVEIQDIKVDDVSSKSFLWR